MYMDKREIKIKLPEGYRKKVSFTLNGNEHIIAYSKERQRLYQFIFRNKTDKVPTWACELMQ